MDYGPPVVPPFVADPPQLPEGAALLAWEAEMIAAVRAGDPKGIDGLYRAFAPRLYERVLLPRLRNAAAADDAVSEVFGLLRARIHQFESRGQSIYGWLCRIAANRAFDDFRKSGRQQRLLERSASLAASDEGLTESPESMALQLREGALVRDEVHAVLERLHPRYAQVLRSRLLAGCPRAQCAAELGVSIGTFDVVLLRAVRAFREAWLQTRLPTEEASP